MEPHLLDIQRLHRTEQDLLERCVAIIITLRIRDDVKLSGEESGQFVTSTKYVKILQVEFHFHRHHQYDRHLMTRYVMNGVPGGEECVDASLAIGQVFYDQYECLGLAVIMMLVMRMVMMVLLARIQTNFAVVLTESKPSVVT